MSEDTGGKGVVERRKLVSGGGLGQVRCVEDVMCSEQVQQDGAGGRVATVSAARSVDTDLFPQCL